MSEASNKSEQRLGAFVTNKWLVGTLVMLCMSMGGYIFTGIDRTSDATAATLRELRTSIIELQIARARTDAQYAEIMRRFDRLDVSIARLEGRR
jgi:hypothetical protein